MTALAFLARAFRWVADALGIPRWTFAVLLGMTVAIAVLSVRLRSEAKAHFLASLRADNAEAAADTTRAVLARTRGVVALLGDSLRAVTRRAVQAAQKADALDRVVGVERVARLRAEARFDSLLATITAPVADDSSGTRRATFQIERPPYHGTAAVTLPRPPADGAIDLRLGLDPAPLDVRLVCGAARDRVRSASVIVAGPPWLTVRVDEVTQSPEVCNPAASVRSGGIRGWRLYVLLGLAVLGGHTLAH